MHRKRSVGLFLILALVISLMLQAPTVTSQSSFTAQDPGVRGGAAGAGDPIAGLSRTQLAFFNAGRDDFVEVEEVAAGLGPRMNLDACGSCHVQPMVGGTSPAVNPQVAFATKNGATNSLPSFFSPSCAATCPPPERMRGASLILRELVPRQLIRGNPQCPRPPLYLLQPGRLLLAGFARSPSTPNVTFRGRKMHAS
jgi:hypothetical protein